LALIDIGAALDKAWAENATVIPLTGASRLAIFSDIHRGAGDAADDFRHNRRVFARALDHYYRGGFTYIEVGDGDELYENRRWADIVAAYPEIFLLLQKFHAARRLVYILGNHNQPLANRARRKALLAGVRRITPGLFPGFAVHQSARLGDRIFLFHGHQADLLSRRVFEPAGRLLIRYVWKFLQVSFGFRDPTSAAQNVRKKTNLERECLEWARRHGRMAVFGHTHRPLFMSLSLKQRLDGKPERPWLFNPGSGVHPECVTGLEVSGRMISLVKWRAVPGRRGPTDGRVKRKALLRCSLRKVLAGLGAPRD